MLRQRDRRPSNPLQTPSERPPHPHPLPASTGICAQAVVSRILNATRSQLPDSLIFITRFSPCSLSATRVPFRSYHIIVPVIRLSYPLLLPSSLHVSCSPSFFILLFAYHIILSSLCFRLSHPLLFPSSLHISYSLSFFILLFASPILLLHNKPFTPLLDSITLCHLCHFVS